MPTTESMHVLPEAPATLQESGVSADLVLQLVAKTLNSAGELTGTEVAERLGVGFRILEPALDLLKREQQCHITGGGALGPPSYRYRLTDAGRVRAAFFLGQNSYVGRMPVPLEQYAAYIRAYRRNHRIAVTRESIRRAFSHLVLSSRVLDQLGPAIAAGHSLFIYGPPGNGKTVMGQAIRNVLSDDIAIPHAISVEGEIIRMFDPANHEVVERTDDDEGLERQAHVDERWLRCRRPLLTVGGELNMDALDLTFNPITGVYRAPLQALSNGGVLVIDDFGRQQAPPSALLNRWIVPLESRIDYLTLRSGQKIELPFEVLVVFATNLKPSELVDEAFLRRIQFKVLAETPTKDEFIQIFENYCTEADVQFDRTMVEDLLEQELRPRRVSLRGCQPRDLVEQALAIAQYLDHPRMLTRELLAAACASYFVEDSDLATA